MRLVSIGHLRNFNMLDDSSFGPVVNDYDVDPVARIKGHRAGKYDHGTHTGLQMRNRRLRALARPAPHQSKSGEKQEVITHADLDSVEKYTRTPSLPSNFQDRHRCTQCLPLTLARFTDPAASIIAMKEPTAAQSPRDLIGN